MAHPNPVWLKGERKRQKVSERWYIKVDEKFGVMADKYNLILVETGTLSTGQIMPWPRGYTSTFKYMAEIMAKHGMDKNLVESFRNRTKDFQTEIKDGKLLVHIPENFVFDESPFKEEEQKGEDA